MKNLIETIQKNIKWKHHTYTYDNVIFRLHYRITTLLLIVMVMLVGSQELIGEHIKCIAPGDESTSEDFEKILNRYCFATTTFTVVKFMNATLLNRGEIIYPGVGAHGQLEEDDVKYHAYYQWVPFVLFAQALLFYLPHLIWKKKEGERMKKLIDGLEYAALARTTFERPITISDKEVPTMKKVQEKFGILKKYLTDSLIVNRYWTHWLIACELLNLCTTLLNIWLTHVFLGGNFVQLGLKLLREGFESAVDPLDIVFPKMTKCIFYKYGPSGTLQPIDTICVMALNVLNEKVYAILWFWFMTLLALTMMVIFWRILSVCFYSRSTFFNKVVFTCASTGRINIQHLMAATRNYNFPNWLFLVYLAKNMNSLVFVDFLDGLAEDLQFTPPLLDFLMDRHHEGFEYTNENERISSLDEELYSDATTDPYSGNEKNSQVNYPPLLKKRPVASKRTKQSLKKVSSGNSPTLQL